MRTNVLEYLEESLPNVPDKICYADDDSQLTFGEVSAQARAVGSWLAAEGYAAEPVIVFMKRSPQTIVAFLGTIYGGCHYVPIDEEIPRSRIELILANVQPRLCIADDSTASALASFDLEARIVRYSEISVGSSDDAALAAVRDKQLDIDPIYVVFTSGSTGVPKGVVACHRSVIDYIETLSDVLRVDRTTVFGNQTPLYFDAPLKEIFPTLKFGATAWLIPKQLFLFPLKLVEYLNTREINTICWVVSALTLISGFRVLDQLVPRHLRTIAFGSEVFPIKQFNIWRKALPEARFINLYGPTEATGMSCWFEVDRPFELEEAIPIGRPFRNTEILLISADNRLVPDGETGEICIRGTSVTLGYYRDEARTREVFVQNPLQQRFPETIYRTGDLGYRNARGELMFVSRKDYQIKHMGYRIELGEIEAVVNALTGVRSGCCVYDAPRSKIVLYYAGESSTAAVLAALKERLPRYMMPNRVERLEALPLTANGKIDRMNLRNRLDDAADLRKRLDDSADRSKT